MLNKDCGRELKICIWSKARVISVRIHYPSDHLNSGLEYSSIRRLEFLLREELAPDTGWKYGYP